MNKVSKRLAIAKIVSAVALSFTPLYASADLPPEAGKSPSVQSEAHRETVVLDVPGMTCAFCPITVRKALERVNGVIEATASYDSKTATVVYDPNRTDIGELTKATENAGYPSTPRPSR